MINGENFFDQPIKNIATGQGESNLSNKVTYENRYSRKYKGLFYS